MINLNAFRSSNFWSKLLTFIISFTFILTWLPFVRSISDGESYSWGISYFGTQIQGSGINLSFLFLVLQLFLYLALFIGLYRIQNRHLFLVLVIYWWVNVFGNFLFEIFLNNGDFKFHGDTLGIHISLSMIVIPLSIISLGTVFMFFRSESNVLLPSSLPLTKKNKLLGILFLISLLILPMLLASGQPHGTTDQIGVILAVIQCFYLPKIFHPYPVHNQK